MFWFAPKRWALLVGSGLCWASGLVAALASGPPEPAEGRVSYLWHPLHGVPKSLQNRGFFDSREKSRTEYKSVVFVLKYTHG
jgi:hypothetical protein